MTLGEKLKDLRKKQGFTQEKLAEQLAVSRQAITKWETDGGIPDIENITAIASCFTFPPITFYQKKAARRLQPIIFMTA